MNFSDVTSGSRDAMQPEDRDEWERLEIVQAAQEKLAELKQHLASTKTELEATQAQFVAQEARIAAASANAQELQMQLEEVTAQVVDVVLFRARGQAEGSTNLAIRRQRVFCLPRFVASGAHGRRHSHRA